MIKKTDRAREAFRAGDYKTSLRLAKTFRLGLNADERAALVRAYECIVHPEFYRSIGKDPETEIERGLRVFEEKIMGIRSRITT